MADLKDILENDDELNQEDLMKYLQGNASEEERFAIEKQMADSSFMDDAVEGLQHFKTPEDARKYAEQLNHQLQKYTSLRQARKKKRKLRDQNWLVVAILAILLLCVVGYLLIHYFMNRN
jgi:ABC-type transport system involved in cytochrome bd biosynthesis fused ATPase/permease subunit